MPAVERVLRAHGYTLSIAYLGTHALNAVVQPC
jgi:hypothetical protein